MDRVWGAKWGCYVNSFVISFPGVYFHSLLFTVSAFDELQHTRIYHVCVWVCLLNTWISDVWLSEAFIKLWKDPSHTVLWFNLESTFILSIGNLFISNPFLVVDSSASALFLHDSFWSSFFSLICFNVAYLCHSDSFHCVCLFVYFLLSCGFSPPIF